MPTKRSHFLLKVNKGETFLSYFEHLSELKVFVGILADSDEKLYWTHTEISRNRICKTIVVKEVKKEGYRVKYQYLSEISFKKHLGALVKKSMMHRLTRGSYMINENYLK